MPEFDQPASERPGFDFSKSRVLLLDEKDCVLLFLTKAAVATNPTRWVTPGGHVEPGESHVVAASRELFEETGLQVAPDALGGPVRSYEFSDERAPGVFRTNYEEWFVYHTTRFEPQNANWTPSELVDIEQFRWWSLSELEAITLEPTGGAATADATALEIDVIEPADLAAVIRSVL